METYNEVTHADDELRHFEKTTWRKGTLGRKLLGWYNKYDFSTKRINDNHLESTVYCLNSDVDAAWSVYSTLLSYDCFSDYYAKRITNVNNSEQLSLRLHDSVNWIVECVHDAMRDNVDCTGFIKVSYQPRRELVELASRFNTRPASNTIQDAEEYTEELLANIVKLQDIATRYAKMLAEVCATTDLTNLGQ